MVFDFGIVTIPLLVAAVVGAASGAAGGCWATTGSALCQTKPPPRSPPPPSPSPSPHLESCAHTWSECGKGVHCCNNADACFKQNDLYSQCLRIADGCPTGWDCEAASPASPGSPPPSTPNLEPTWGFLALCAAASAIVCAFLVGLCLERRWAGRNLRELVDLRQGTPRYQSNYSQPDSHRLLPSSLTPSESVSWYTVLTGRARASPPLSMRGERSEPPPVPSLAPPAGKKSANRSATRGDTSSPHPPPPPPPPPPPTAAEQAQAGEEREPVRVFL